MSTSVQRTPALERLTEYHIGWLLLFWVGVCAFFALAYTVMSHIDPAHSLNLFVEQEMQLLDRMLHSLYFSFTTAAKIGYGDIAPIGISKGIAAIQAIISLVFLAVIIAKLLLLRPTKTFRRP
ncbi:MAG: ion channel [Candidatus Peribacter sp.]|jgi:potassium channel LctB